MRAYTVIVHDEEEGGDGFWAEVEELPGCFASGDTLEELEQDVKNAIEAHVSVLKELGRPVPEGIECAEPKLRRWQIAVSA
jgi:predicted RNase H-like HicB family nuclease